MGFDWRRFFDWLFERNLIPFYLKKEEFLEKLSVPGTEILPLVYDHIRKLEKRNEDLESIVNSLAEIRLYHASKERMGIMERDQKKTYDLVKLARFHVQKDMEDGL